MAEWDHELDSLQKQWQQLQGSASPLECELKNLMEAKENISALIYIPQNAGSDGWKALRSQAEAAARHPATRHGSGRLRQ